MPAAHAAATVAAASSSLTALNRLPSGAVPSPRRDTSESVTPLGAVGKPQRFDRRRVHLDRVARRLGHHVRAVAHLRRVQEVLVQVVGVLGGAVGERAADAQVVDDRDVLHVLAQPDAAGVRAHRHATGRGQQQHRQHLVEPAEATRVDLRVVDRLGLQQLLEDQPVGRVLTGGDAHRAHAAADGCVTEHVVGVRRLLDPAQPERAAARSSSRWPAARPTPGSHRPSAGCRRRAPRASPRTAVDRWRRRCPPSS
jgi:hypothetical protein